MKLFISWSGTQSRQIAQHLRDWIPDVIQDVEPFMSAEDIGLGTRWSPEIARQLDETNFGLIVVTKTNLDARWLNFEAGALGKAVADARVIPVLFGISKSDVSGPLAQFQMMEWSRETALELMKAINSATERGVDVTRLPGIFDRWWPDLEGKVANTADDAPAPTVAGGRPSSRGPHRQDRELLEEALDLLRGLSRQLKSTAPPPRPSVRALFEGGPDARERATKDVRARIASVESLIRDILRDHRVEAEVLMGDEGVMLVEYPAVPSREVVQQVREVENVAEFPIEQRLSSEPKHRF